MLCTALLLADKAEIARAEFRQIGVVSLGIGASDVWGSKSPVTTLNHLFELLKALEAHTSAIPSQFLT